MGNAAHNSAFGQQCLAGRAHGRRHDPFTAKLLRISWEFLLRIYPGRKRMVWKRNGWYLSVDTKMNNLFSVTGPTPCSCNERSRKLFRKNNISINDLMQVILIRPNGMENLNELLPSFQITDLKALVKDLKSSGITSIKLFAGEHKGHKTIDRAISSENNLINAIRELKSLYPELFIAVETCLCSYTESGSCGIFSEKGSLLIEDTLEVFKEMAVLQAVAGADALGPAAMIKGTISACRDALDSQGLTHISIMPHLIFSSPFYRGYRKTMGIHSERLEDYRSALHADPYDYRVSAKLALDMVSEGADSILAEPALFILDQIRIIRNEVNVPIGCFSVSGEYYILSSDITDKDHTAQIEFCRAAKRSGSDFIATYAAIEIARHI